MISPNLGVTVGRILNGEWYQGFNDQNTTSVGDGGMVLAKFDSRANSRSPTTAIVTVLQPRFCGEFLDSFWLVRTCDDRHSWEWLRHNREKKKVTNFFVSVRVRSLKQEVMLGTEVYTEA